MERKIRTKRFVQGLVPTLALPTLLGLVSPIQAVPMDLFVRPEGMGTDCTQASPCGLQTAMAQARDGDTIYVAAGTYTGSGDGVITISKSITLRGGWDGAASGPVNVAPDAYTTTLDGEGARRVVYIEGPVTVTLEGLVIANGKITSTMSTWNGAGLYARDAALTVRRTNFFRNVIDVYETADSIARGAGMMAEGGSLLIEASTFRWNDAWAARVSEGGGLAISSTVAATVRDCVFQENDAWQASGLYFKGQTGTRTPFTLSNSTFSNNGLGRGAGRAHGGYAGALKMSDAQARVEGNTFRGNKASNDYGAVAAFDSELSLERNVIYGNQNGRTAGLYLSNVSPFRVVNNVIAGNQSMYYWVDNAAVQVRSGSGQFLHNTIARNRNFSDSNVGVEFGVLVDSNSTVSLTNTILVGHTVGIRVTAGSTATLEGTLWGSGVWRNNTDWDGDGNITTGTVNVWGDPSFVNPDDGDYHIAPSSEAIDAGVDAGVTMDIDGDQRPIGAGYDIGADELASFTLTVAKSGTGTGTVTSSPEGISCGADCSEAYTAGTTVTLTATPDTDSVFSGWSGDCSGTDPAVTVIVDGEKSCIATFSFASGPDLTGRWERLAHTCKNTRSGPKCKLSGTLRVGNRGDQAAPPGALVYFYLSSDGTWDSGDSLLKQVAVGALKAGRSKTRKLSYALPLGESAQGKYVIAWIDATGAVAETNEANNMIVSEELQ